MTRALLTLNAGSSSLKMSMFEIDGRALNLRLRGQVEGIGVAPSYVLFDPDGARVDERTWSDPATPFGTLLETVMAAPAEHLHGAELAAVGHRVVHGGARFVHPELVTPELMVELEALCPLAPLHQPHNLAPIGAIARSRPGLPQVACFDTAFHATMAPVATRFALPRSYEAAGVRRYGFHGLSYEFIAGRLARTAPALAAGKVIVAHLGAGASLCAMSGGFSVDTTMGFTALDGLVMGTRCGAIDPGVLIHLQRAEGLSWQAVEDLLYKRSGLLGVSGVSSDMRVLLASAEPAAAEAVELFIWRIARDAGALTSTLGGLDGLVFTAGVGQHAAAVRAGVCERLAWLGVVLDPAANAADAGVISAPASRVEVRVIPTDEEAVIAGHTLARTNP